MKTLSKGEEIESIRQASYKNPRSETNEVVKKTQPLYLVFMKMSELQSGDTVGDTKAGSSENSRIVCRFVLVLTEQTERVWGHLGSKRPQENNKRTDAVQIQLVAELKTSLVSPCSVQQ